MPYFSSPEYSRLKSALQEMGLNPAQCVYIDIGHDGFSPYDVNHPHSTWGIWMKVKNVDPTVHFRYMNTRELYLFPQSPRRRWDNEMESVQVEAVLELLYQELEALCLANKPLDIHNAYTNTTTPMHIVLATMMGDSPARSKVSCAGTAISIFPCHWCLLQSSKGPSAKGQGST